jgi:hypothetical protein
MVEGKPAAGGLDLQPFYCPFRNTIELMLQIAALSELAFCWNVWSLAFVRPSKQAAGKKEVSSAPASRWGIFLVMLGFALIWAYVRPLAFKRPPSH